MNPEYVAEQLYNAYCGAVGWVAFNNDPLPEWEDFSNDPSKTKQANAWRAAATRAIKLLEN